MDTQSNSRRALKSVQEQEDQRRWRNKRDRARCAAETAEQRTERLKKRRERDHARPAAQAASERRATSQWKSTHKHGAETLRGERWGTEVQQYDTLKEAMKTWRNNLHFLHRTATHIHGGAATNYSVIPWGGAAFSATLFSRQVLLINITSIIMMKGFRLGLAQQHFQSCDLLIHVVFYHSLKMSCSYTSQALFLGPPQLPLAYCK